MEPSGPVRPVMELLYLYLLPLLNVFYVNLILKIGTDGGK